jgi:hypothetical protein
VLESQVGTNPRVRVQQDDAFILWDKIAFDEEPTSGAGTNGAAMPSSTAPSPEWVRRTICCVQWETENADSALPRVVVATLAPQQQSPSASTTAPGGDAPQQQLLQHSEPAPTSPVPLPAPHHPQQHRFEPRVTGTLVAYWARRARIAVLDVPPTGLASEDRAAPEDRRFAHHPHPHHHHRGRGGSGGGGGGGGGGMVERPPAVQAMMNMVAQPSKVVRVLARGEKLDP